MTCSSFIHTRHTTTPTNTALPSPAPVPDMFEPVECFASLGPGESLSAEKQEAAVCLVAGPGSRSTPLPTAITLYLLKYSEVFLGGPPAL